MAASLRLAGMDARHADAGDPSYQRGDGAGAAVAFRRAIIAGVGAPLLPWFLTVGASMMAAEGCG